MRLSRECTSIGGFQLHFCELDIQPQSGRCVLAACSLEWASAEDNGARFKLGAIESQSMPGRWHLHHSRLQCFVMMVLH